ncbi:MAG: signal peptidase I [Bacillota bacterium]
MDERKVGEGHDNRPVEMAGEPALVTERHRLWRESKEWLQAFLLAIVLFFLIRTFLFAPLIVDGESMAPTLHSGERLIVTKFVYLWGEPQRGDIVVFHATQNRDYIKRVIGLPGETVEVRDDRLYIDGKEVPEPYLDEYRRKTQEAGLKLTEDFGPTKVPEGAYFVLGDNRRNSLDSRMIGVIPKEQIVGRADLVFWPLSSFRWLN